jgi:hypothetical protein
MILSDTLSVSNNRETNVPEKKCKNILVKSNEAVAVSYFVICSKERNSKERLDRDPCDNFEIQNMSMLFDYLMSNC